MCLGGCLVGGDEAERLQFKQMRRSGMTREAKLVMMWPSSDPRRAVEDERHELQGEATGREGGHVDEPSPLDDADMATGW